MPLEVVDGDNKERTNGRWSDERVATTGALEISLETTVNFLASA